MKQFEIRQCGIEIPESRVMPMQYELCERVGMKYWNSYISFSPAPQPFVAEEQRHI